MLAFDMHPDDDVPVKRTANESKRGRKADPRIQAYVDKFVRFKPGQSFFVQGITPADLDFLRKPFARAGVGVVIRRVERDEIYAVPGVRVWRLAGDYDEL